MGSIIRSTRTVFYSLLYLNSRQGFNGLKYLSPVISVKMERRPGNAKNRLFPRPWTVRVRLAHSWAVSQAPTCVETWSRNALAVIKPSPRTTRSGHDDCRWSLRTSGVSSYSGARQAEGLWPQSRRAPLAISQSSYGVRTDFFFGSKKTHVLTGVEG